MIDAERYGPWAVVAGGSEGVGAAFARQLAEAGVNLVLLARREEPLREAAAEAEKHGVEVRTLALDLLDPATPETVARETAGLDVGLLVFNAGANTHGGEFVESPMAAMRQVLDLNITAQLALAHHFGARLKARGRGGLLLVGSLAGFLGHEEISIYSAAKAFGRIFAEGLWLELAPHGVDVLELVLGVTRTPAMERAGLHLDLPGLNVAEPEDVAREGLERLPYGPVHVAGGNQQAAEAQSGFPRDLIVRKTAEASRDLLPDR